MSNRIKRLFLIVLISLLFSHFGCIYGKRVINPVTGKVETIYIDTTAEEISMGQQLHDKIASKYQISQNKNLIHRVNLIGEKIAVVSERRDIEYVFYVIEDEEYYSFSIPGGNNRHRWNY